MKQKAHLVEALLEDLTLDSPRCAGWQALPSRGCANA